MKLKEIITKVDVIAGSTAKTFIDATIGCATGTAAAALPCITITSAVDKICSGKWNFKSNTTEYFKTMAIYSAAIVSAATTVSAVSAAARAIAPKEQTTETNEESSDSYESFTECEED